MAIWWRWVVGEAMNSNPTAVITCDWEALY